MFMHQAPSAATQNPLMLMMMMNGQLVGPITGQGGFPGLPHEAFLPQQPGQGPAMLPFRIPYMVQTPDGHMGFPMAGWGGSPWGGIALASPMMMGAPQVVNGSNPSMLASKMPPPSFGSVPSINDYLASTLGKKKSAIDDDSSDDDVVSEIHGGSSRLSIRTHSKAQREKRKAYVAGLEATARAMSSSGTQRRQKMEDCYETLKITHDVLRHQTRAFLRLLLAADAVMTRPEDVLPGEDAPTVWLDVLDTSRQGFTVRVPALNFSYAPPTAREKDAQESVLTLTSVDGLNAFSAGLRIAWEAIARVGTNTARSLSITLRFDQETFLSDAGNVSVRCVAESRNAHLLGGRLDVSFDGKLVRDCCYDHVDCCVSVYEFTVLESGRWR